MYVIQIRQNLFLWMFFVTCDQFVSPVSDCLTDGLTRDGGAAEGEYENYDRTFGCTTGCRYITPEVHVLAQVGPSGTEDREVYVTLFNECNLQVDVKLVLISQEAVTWVVEHAEYEDDTGSSNNDNVNVKDILVYQTRTQGTQIRSTVIGSETEGEHRGWLPLVMPQNLQNRTEISKLRDWLNTEYKVTSINYGRRPISWELDINECCGIKRPVTSAPIFPITRSTAGPATPNMRSDSQGGAGHPKTIIVVVVIVILTVVLISAVILGTCWYYRRQKQKRPQASSSRVPRSGDGGLSSLEGPTNVHAQANVYNLSPSAPPLP